MLTFCDVLRNVELLKTVGAAFKSHFITKVCNQKAMYICLSLAKQSQFKQRYQLTQVPDCYQQPVQARTNPRKLVTQAEMDKVQRNKRERNRVKALNGCLVELMRRLPNSNHITMTKAQILKRATDYIDFLETRIRVMQDSLRNRDDERTERSFSRPSCRFSKVGSAFCWSPFELKHDNC